jgi:hypothetical protein
LVMHDAIRPPTLPQDAIIVHRLIASVKSPFDSS